MKRLSPVLLALVFISAGSCARALVPDMAITDTQTQKYSCKGGKLLKVRYLTGHNGQSFALLTPADKPMLFVQTLAASGVKYQADRFVWWTKGAQGDLYDMMRGQGAAPVADCHTN